MRARLHDASWVSTLWRLGCPGLEASFEATSLHIPSWRHVRMSRTRSCALALGAAAFVLWSLAPARGQQGTPATGEWRANGGDSGSTRYSPLDQINAANVKNLQVVWRWKAQNMGPAPQAAW